jgi:hypothetical protein
MQGPMLCVIIPLGSAGGPVDPGYGVPGWPAHPIAPGGRPPGIWGGPPNYVDIGPPGPQPPPWYPGAPTHPIPPGVWPTPPGSPPLGTWGGANQPFPSNPIAPGGPPPSVSHPIPPGIWPTPPGGGAPTPPPWWPGAPTHPIPPIVGGGPIVPPPGVPEAESLIDWKSAWSPTTGWVVVGIPQVPVPTPSKDA